MNELTCAQGAGSTIPLRCWHTIYSFECTNQLPQIRVTRFLSTQHVITAGAVLVMFLWALCFPLISFGLAAVPPMLFAFLRALIAGLSLLLIAKLLKRPGIESASIWINIAFVGLTATSIGFFGMFYGGGLVSPGMATVLSNFQPLIAAVLASFFLSEVLKIQQIYGLVMGFIGIILISLTKLLIDQSNIIGIGYILFAALGIAISNILLKLVAHKVDIIVAMGWQLVIGSVPLGILSMVLEGNAEVSWTLPFISSLLVLSIFGTALVFVLWFKLLTISALSRLNVFTFLTPVFGIVMGVLFYSETMHYLDVVGVLIIISGIFLVTRNENATRNTSTRAN